MQLSKGAAPACDANTVRYLRERNDFLIEENRQLKEALAPRAFLSPLQKVLKIQPKQAQILSALIACAPNIVCHERIYLSAYGAGGVEKGLRVKVHISMIRGALKDLGLGAIYTHWGEGYSINSKTKEKILKLLESEPKKDAQ